MKNANTAFDKTVEALRSQGMDAEAILEELSKLFRKLEADTAGVKADTSAKLKALLKDCGIPNHILGYSYLMVAIPMYRKNPRQKITSELYPSVARHFETTGSRVERGIRHAIECGFDRCGADMITMVWGNTLDPSRGKPTNREFIAHIADML